MKYSEVVGKNFFEMPSSIPGKALMYYLDYHANGKSRAAYLLKKKGIKKLPKDLDVIVYDNKFALIGAYIKLSDMQKFEECMQELERTAPFFCKGYKDARIKILDDIVIMESSEA